MNPTTQTKPEDPATKPAGHRLLRFGLLRHSVAWVLVAQVVLIVTAPLVLEIQGTRSMEAVLVSLMLMTAVLAVGGRRKTLALAVVLAAPAFIARWVEHFWPGDKSVAFSVACFLVFLGFVVFQFLRFVLRSPRVTSEVLCAAVATYIMLAQLWGAAYMLVARLSPGAISGLAAGQGFNAMYFSLITLTTVGYGDIVPVSSAARMLAMMEAMTGTMYVAVLISRLVALYSSESASEERGTRNEKDSQK